MKDISTYMSPNIDAINETLYEMNMERKKKKDMDKTIDKNIENLEKNPRILSDEEMRDLGNNY